VKNYALDIRDAAYEDLAGIRNYIADARGQTFAEHFIARILDHLATFKTAPFRGTRQDELRPGLRIVGWRHTITIAFVPDESLQKVTILAVLYRGRDVATALKQR
jgi:plasmid stabilization system protein ParE